MEYTDSEFLNAVESCAIESFHHADHIRLALIYASRYAPDEARDRLAATIRGLAKHAGHPEKYHHTMTLAWMRLVSNLLDPSALKAYYSDALLSEDRARREWVEPDLALLP